MTSPKPLFWLQAASDEQLAAFCEHNAALTTLLHEAWQKFQTDRADLFSKQPAFSAEPYAPNVSPDELTHSAISPAEMAEFLRTFDRNRSRNDKPFGDDVAIQDRDWDVL